MPCRSAQASASSCATFVLSSRPSSGVVRGLAFDISGTFPGGPDGPLLRRIAMSGIAVAIRSPGGLRYQLGEMPDSRFEPRTARPIDAFVADVDALLVPKRSPDNEGVEREIDLALLSRRPVVVRQSSNHAPRVRAAAGGRLVSDDDEAFDAVIALARAEDVPPARAPGSAEERLASARQSFGAALALGARRLAS